MKSLIMQTISFSLRAERLKIVVYITAIVIFSFEIKWFLQYVAFNFTTGPILTLFPPRY